MGEWLPINQLFDFEKGTLQSSKCTPGQYTFITAAEEWKTHAAYTHDCEALIFAMAASGSLGRTHHFKGKFTSSDLCFILIPKRGKELDLKFYYRVFNFLREDIVKRTATGTSKLAINQTNFGNYQLPFFNINHQLAFTGKLDNISEIKNSLVNGFLSQSENLSLLRQTILQDAIKGKLTADWRKKHPACKGNQDTDAVVLLTKIRVHWESFQVRSRAIKNGFLIEPLNELNGWVKTNIDSIGIVKVGGTPGRNNFAYWNGKIPWVSSGEVANCEIFDTKEHITILGSSESAAKIFPAGSVLVAMIGQGKTRGQAAILRIDASTNQNVCGIIIDHGLIEPMFLYYYFLSRYEESRSYASGGNQPALNGEKIGKFVINLPPINEQNEIIKRVGKLLAMVDELEKQVAERKGQAQMLMQAVLREAFEGK